MNLLSDEKQGKLQLCTSLKEHPRFENYLNLCNEKLRQAITKLRIVHTNSQLKQDVLIIGSGLKESVPCVVMVLEMRCTI